MTRIVADAGQFTGGIPTTFPFGRFLARVAAEFAPPVTGDVSVRLQGVLQELADYAGCDDCRMLRQTSLQTSICDACGLCSDAPRGREDLCSPFEADFDWLRGELWRGRVVTILQLADFPVEAQAERSYYERLGMQSCIFVPVHTEVSSCVAIAFESRTVVTAWTEELAQVTRVAGQAIANGLRCIDHSQCVFERLDFERTVAETAANMANLPADEVVQGVLQGLAAFGRLAGADACVLMPAGSVAQTLTPPLQWVSSASDLTCPLIAPAASGILQTLPKTAAFSFHRLEDLPKSWRAARKLLADAGVQSGLLVPVFSDAECFGAVGFYSFRAGRHWPESWTSRLMLVGQLFANALIRAQKNQELLRLKEQLQSENAYLKEEIRLRHRHEAMVGDSKAMKQIMHRVEKVAGTGATVLICGETGTGKELIADAIHQLSPRRERPMITVNCAAIPAPLAEAELFGHKAGAYTGADTDGQGRFDVADGSTIFLDEVGELPLEVQSKLLRVLECGQFQRVGSSVTTQVDVRILAATNRDLDQEVRAGRFRDDLYHRLNVVPIHMPPLRERMEDIPLLVETFVAELSKRMGRPALHVPASLIQRLQSYRWPGNIRELRHTLERALILAEDGVLTIDLPSDYISGASGLTLQEMERTHILRILERVDGRIEGEQGAADLLGLKPSTLRSRMSKLGINRK